MIRWSLLVSLTLLGCAADEVPLGTTTADTGATVVADTARPDTFVDAGSDVGPDGSEDSRDTSFDAASVVTATIKEEYLFQNCTPGSPKPDPLQIKATITVDNPTSATLGTVTSAKGKVLSGAVTVATFTFPEVSIALPGRTMGMATFEKTAGSVDPKAGCSTLTCDGMVTIEVTLTGPGATIVARSADIRVECAF